MWEESPKYQESNYRFLIRSVAFLIVVGTIWCIASRSWEMLGHLFGTLAILVGAVCIWAGTIWLVAQCVRGVFRLIRSAARKHSSDA